MGLAWGQNQRGNKKGGLGGGGGGHSHIETGYHSRDLSIALDPFFWVRIQHPLYLPCA